jgi:hypothetical protein
MTTPGYLRQTFEARALPELIEFGEVVVVGPFCVHCGNPLSAHGPEQRCPNQHLHPLYPPPRLPLASGRNL